MGLPMRKAPFLAVVPALVLVSSLAHAAAIQVNTIAAIGVAGAWIRRRRADREQV
jgi:hypothetical protein